MTVIAAHLCTMNRNTGGASDIVLIMTKREGRDHSLLCNIIIYIATIRESAMDAHACRYCKFMNLQQKCERKVWRIGTATAVYRVAGDVDNLRPPQYSYKHYQK